MKKTNGKRVPKARPKKTEAAREKRRLADRKSHEAKNPTPTNAVEGEKLTLEDLKLLKSFLRNSVDIESRLVPIDDLEKRAKLLDAKLERIIKNELDPNLVMAAVAGSVATPPKIGDVVSVMMPNAPNTDKKNPEDKFSVYNTLRQLHKNFPVHVGNWHKSQYVQITLPAGDWLIASSCIKAVLAMLPYVSPGDRERIQDVFGAIHLEFLRAYLAQAALHLKQRPQDPKPSPITPAPSPQEAQNPSTSPNPEPSAPGTTQTSSHPQNAALRVSQVSSAEKELRKRAGTPSAAGLIGPFDMGTNAHAQVDAQVDGQSGSRDKPEGGGGTEAKYREANREAARRVFTRNLTDAEREKIAKEGIERHFVGAPFDYRDEMAKLVADWKLEQGVKAARTRFEQMSNNERAEARHVDVARVSHHADKVSVAHRKVELMEQEDFPNVVVVTFVGHKGDERSIVVKGASSITNALSTAVKNHAMAHQYWDGGVSRIKVATYVDASGAELLRWRLELTREAGELFWCVDDVYGNPPKDAAPFGISMPWEGERG